MIMMPVGATWVRPLSIIGPSSEPKPPSNPAASGTRTSATSTETREKRQDQKRSDRDKAKQPQHPAIPDTVRCVDRLSLRMPKIHSRS